MAVLESLICSHCGGPITQAELKKCPYCGKANQIQSKKEVNPLKMAPQAAQQYIDFFKKKTDENPKDTNALFAMGMFYLGLKNYELAQRNFQLSIDLSPLEPDVYYYYALSLFAGRSPRVLTQNEAERIQTYLNTAIKMQQKRKYLILKLVLTQGYFELQGLKAEVPVRQLLDEALNIVPEPDDIDEIRTYVNIADASIENHLDMLAGKENCGIEEKDVKNAEIGKLVRIEAFCYKEDLEFDESEEEDVKALNDNPEARREFFQYFHRPVQPEKIAKPFYPIIGRIWKLAIAVGITLLLAIIEMGFVHYCFERIDTRPPKTVQQEFKEIYGTQKLSTKERKEKMEMLRNDSIARAQHNQEFLSNFKAMYFRTAIDGEKQDHFFKRPTPEVLPYITEVGGYRRDWHALVVLLVLLFPILLWALVTTIKVVRIARQRKSIDATNKHNEAQYQHDMHKHMTRATTCGYIHFVRHALRQHDALVPGGDPVSCILQKQHINESELPAKILLSTWFANNTDQVEGLLGTVHFCVAIPEKDCVTLCNGSMNTITLESAWNYQSVYYNAMNGLQKIDDRIYLDQSQTNIIELPPTEDYISVYNFSDESRTSDPDEFFSALNRLIRSYNAR